MYLHNDKEQFIQAVNLASYQLSVMESIVEKDYYVTMLLRLLAERVPSVVFKGGTSLPKCHKAILRFSEDIDIAVDTSGNFFYSSFISDSDFKGRKHGRGYDVS